MGILNKILEKKQEVSWMYDLELLQDTSVRAYLKRMAIQTCIEFLARTISQSEFRITKNHKIIKDKTYYKLNVRPNTDSSATDFWQKVIYKLIYDNEVLIVVSDSKDLLVADDYERKKFALYPDHFKHVRIDEYEFERTFNMDEVIYLKYNNEKLNQFTDGLFEDYGEIFGRMINAQKRNYQIRGILNNISNKVENKEEIEKTQAYITKILKSFNENSVAVAPLTKNFDFQDLSSSNKSSNAPFEDLTKLQKSLLDNVAKAIGIPPSLIHGDLADLENALESYNKFCVKPLLKKIENELNAKLFTENEILNGKKIKVISVDKVDPLEMSDSIDKLVGSGTFNRNQVRIMVGEEPVDDPEMDKYYITKNYKESKSGESNEQPLKGGENHESKR